MQKGLRTNSSWHTQCMQEGDDSYHYIKPHRVLLACRRLRLTQHTHGAFSVLQAFTKLPASHDRQRWDRSKGSGGQAYIRSSSHPSQEMPTLFKAPPALHSSPSSLCILVLGTTVMGGLPGALSVCLAGWGLRSAEIPVLAQPGGPSCCVHAAKKCLWMTTTPFLSQI